MIPIGKQLYADNFPERALAHKELVGWCCEWCGRKHGEEIIPDIIQLPLKGLKGRRKRKKRKIVLIAHHLNYDTENPDAELIILCRSCHGKAQREHNREMYQIAMQQKKIADTVDQKIRGQLEIRYEEIA
jgi:hypothetical protein